MEQVLPARPGALATEGARPNRIWANGPVENQAGRQADGAPRVVVIMLGSNDVKACFGRTPTDIAEALHGYIDDVATNLAESGRVPIAVLVSPVGDG